MRDRGPQSILRLFPRQEDATIGTDAHVEIVRRQIRVTGQRASPVRSDMNLQAGALFQPLDQAGEKTARDVLHDEDGPGKILWQAREDGLQDWRAPGRRGNG